MSGTVPDNSRCRATCAVVEDVRHDAARRRGRRLDRGDRNERALYKMVCDGVTDRVVGIHMIGPDVPEILQAAAVAVKAGLTKADFDATVALHPTMAEELVLMR